MVGATSIGTKENILATIFERLDVVSVEIDSDTESTDDGDEQDGVDEDELSSDSSNDTSSSSIHEDQEATPPTFSLHQGMYAPLVRLPPTLRSSGLPYGNKTLDSEDPLLAPDTDEKALAAELREEDKLDKEDLIVAGKNENRLWGEYSRRGTRTAEMIATVGEEEFDGHGLRFKPPTMDGQVKSQVYVVDSSDSE
jgi:hypothetical protein